MKYLQSFADKRLLAHCIYCGGKTETREHCPSRILLDEPYPADLPVVPACAKCNTGFSLDEEYFACLVECARSGGPEKAERAKIQRILKEKPALAERINQARATSSDGTAVFSIEHERIRRVVVKLARGHAAFELSEVVDEEPDHVSFEPLHLMSTEVRQDFETPPSFPVWPEVGSRAMQRLAGVGDDSGWLHVQAGRYRYAAAAAGLIVVRIAVADYLACEVIWD
jgi:hypothetical protein